MPILPNAQDCIKVDLLGTIQGVIWSNTIHFQGETGLGAPTTAHLSTFCDAVAAAWTTNIAPLCNPLTLLTDVNAAILTTRTSPVFRSHLTSNVPGTNTGTPLPNSLAVCISWSISRRYRGGHGRIYVPAGNTDDITVGRTIAGAFQTQCNNAASAFLGQLQGLTLNSIPLQVIVLSYFESVQNPDDPEHNITVMRQTPQPFAVTSARVRTRFDSQRRRLGKETV